MSREKDYRIIEIDEQCESLNLIGDIAIDERGEQSVYAVRGLGDGTTRGGSTQL